MRVKDFYADPQRAASREVSFGATWRSEGEGPWKVVWLEATGELVAFHEVPSSPWPYRGNGDDVVPIGVEADGERLRAALHGWERQMPEANGLAWVAERCDDEGAHPDEAAASDWSSATDWGRASEVWPGSEPD